MIVQLVSDKFLVGQCLQVEVVVTLVPLRVVALQLVPPLHRLVLVEEVVGLNAVLLLPSLLARPCLPCRLYSCYPLELLQQVVLPVDGLHIQSMQVLELELRFAEGIRRDWETRRRGVVWQGGSCAGETMGGMWVGELE